MSEISPSETGGATGDDRERRPGTFRPGNDARRARSGAEASRAKARAREAERLEEAAKLRADLDRPTTAVDEALIEAAAGQIVEGRRRRARGLDSAEADRLLTRILGRLTGGKRPARRHRPWHEIRADAERRRAVTVSHEADHVAPRREQHLEQQQHLAGDPLEELARAGQHPDAADLEREHGARAELDAGSRS